MRYIFNQRAALITGLLGVIVVSLLLQPPVLVNMRVYSWLRSAAQLKFYVTTRKMLSRETSHFLIRYTAADAGDIDLIATAAEAAYEPVSTQLGYAPAGKALVVVYPNRNELGKVFGWSGDKSAMGVYWSGVIQILSPQAWLTGENPSPEFIRTGPLVHEYTHLVFDCLVNGNYPRWFTEGLAQYSEYRINGYEWITPDNNLGGELYTLADLDGKFDDLPNQALAYRQSLAMVRYIAEVRGENQLRQVIEQLRAGRRMNQAIESVLGMSYGEFDAAWRAWAVNMADRSY